MSKQCNVITSDEEAKWLDIQWTTMDNGGWLTDKLSLLRRRVRSIDDIQASGGGHGTTEGESGGH